MTDFPRLTALSDDENDTLQHLVKKLADKQPRNLLRASYYDGKHVIRQLGSVVPPQYYKTAMVLGWAAKAVDVLGRRCNLDGFVWPDGDLGSLGIAEVWDGNRLGSESDSAVISALIHSVSFLVNTLGDGDEPRGLIHVKDALSATGDWNPRARRMDNLLSVTARKDDQITGLVLYLDGLTITADKDSSGWSVDRSEHPWGVPVEPVPYKPRVGRPFGSSRISRPVMSMQDAAARAAIRLEGHMDVYSFPEMWLLGADESIFRNADGSQKAAWQVMLGRIKAIPDDEDAAPGLERASVQQFSAQSPEPHLAALNAYAKMFARETSLPDTAVAITDVANPTSAESYDASQHELIAEAEGVTDDAAPAFSRAVARALAMQNGLAEVPSEWASLAPQWRDPRFLSRAAQADAGMKQLTAVPWLAETEVGLQLLGLKPQQISVALAERRRAQGRETLNVLRSAAASIPTEPADGVEG